MSAIVKTKLKTGLDFTVKELAKELIANFDLMMVFLRHLHRNFRIEKSSDVEDIIREIAQFGELKEEKIKDGMVESCWELDLKQIFGKRAVVYARVEIELNRWIERGRLQ